jgi:hypothetical protein
MQDTKNKFDTGKELLDAIKGGELELKDLCIGMVKASEKEDHIAFAPRSCNEWVDVPEELVGEVEVLKQVPCKGHTHPLVQFKLKINESNPVHEMVRQLLSPAVSPTPAEMHTPVNPMSASPSPWNSNAFSYAGGQQGQQFESLYARSSMTEGSDYRGAPLPTDWQFRQKPHFPVAEAGSTQFASVPGKNRITFAAPIGPGGIGGGTLGFIDCDIDCCAACCRDCFPFGIGCIDYPCCKLSNCKIGF